MTVIAVIAGSLAGPRVTARVTERAAMAAGLGVVAAAAVLLTATGGAVNAGLLVAFVLMGAGLGVASVASTAAGTKDGDRPGLASGLLNTAAQLGTAIGLALLIAPAEAAGYGWGCLGAAAAAVTIAGVRRPVAIARARRSPG